MIFFPTGVVVTIWAPVNVRTLVPFMPYPRVMGEADEATLVENTPVHQEQVTKNHILSYAYSAGFITISICARAWYLSTRRRERSTFRSHLSALDGRNE